MLTIRKSQLSILSEAMLAEFVEHALTVSARHWAHQVEGLGPLRAREKVRRAVVQGRAFGFTRRQQAIRYVNVVFALGDDMVAVHPWVRSIVENTNLPADVRIDLLSERTQEYLAGYEVA